MLSDYFNYQMNELIVYISVLNAFSGRLQMRSRKIRVSPDGACAKIFSSPPLDAGHSDPILYSTAVNEPEKKRIKAVETARFALITGSQPHVD